VQQADVLVNVISSKTADLSRAGAVSVAFLDAAGDELQDVSISLPLFTVINNYVWIMYHAVGYDNEQV